MHLIVTNQQARQFLLKKQLLLPAQSLTGEKAIEQVFQTLRVIQYDPLNPCGRNPDLVLQARIENYHPNDYYRWLYTEKKGIEAYDKELCIIPLEDLSYTDHRNLRQLNDIDKKTFLNKHRQVIKDILAQIEKDGPTTSLDIKINKQVTSGWGSSAQVGRIALELLWRMGKLVVVKREGMKKYYDLPQKVHPELFSTPRSLTALQKEHILRRIRSVGMLPKTTTGGGWQGMRGIAKIISSLIKEDKLLEISIENSKLTYLINAINKDELFNTLQTSTNKIAFIAPLDNLIWDRLMLQDLFDFHYRWEVYTPKIKRKFGYYVLPILSGDRFIGRIEPYKLGSKLEIRGLWQERKWNSKEIAEFNFALNKFADYLKVTEIINPFIPNHLS